MRNTTGGPCSRRRLLQSLLRLRWGRLASPTLSSPYLRHLQQFRLGGLSFVPDASRLYLEVQLLAVTQMAALETTGSVDVATDDHKLAKALNGQRAYDVLWLIFLLTAVCVLSLRAATVLDPDLWWHLRTGEWISEHHAVPWRDMFGRYTAGHPWFDYTWLFDWILSQVYRLGGLLAVLAFTGTLTVACVVSLFDLISRRLSQGYALSLTVLYYVALLPIAMPRPWLFSILLLTVELRLLLKASEQNRPWLLGWLIPLFAVWANLHIQFVYGLGVLALFAGVASLPKRWLTRESSSLRPQQWWILLILAATSTLFNPYGWRIYQVVYTYAIDQAGLSMIQEMQPLTVRDIADWAVIALLCLAVGALAWTRKFSILSCSLLLAGCWFGFHKGRDVWFLAILSAAVTAQALREHSRANPLRWRQTMAAVLISGCFYAAEIRWGYSSTADLEQAEQQFVPVDASKFIAERKLPDPLFNTFGWGGYLIWRLPGRLVSIDGRSNLYGNEGVTRFMDTINGAPNWRDNPELQNANTVLIGRAVPLASLLRLDSRYKLAYEDKIAVVFVRIER